MSQPFLSRLCRKYNEYYVNTLAELAAKTEEHERKYGYGSPSWSGTKFCLVGWLGFLPFCFTLPGDIFYRSKPTDGSYKK